MPGPLGGVPAEENKSAASVSSELPPNKLAKLLTKRGSSVIPSKSVNIIKAPSKGSSKR